MFEQMNEQLKSSLKPVSDLAALNMSTLQTLTEKQSALYSSLMSDGMAFVEKATQQKDLTSLAETQKAYAEQLQETLTDAAKDTYGLLTATQQKAGEMVKGMSEEFAASFTVTQ
ncbi:phasin family protein [Alteromonas sp. ASW11-36]|uniref:Phasin family protein n=1 Tax=Alteromonas arenosi TaxID=3055817 RepID=A0ABT7T1F7_9ALTE|nr:phasin family protein [Alteromonas sp. ASW11-36]MDM7862284.1 phasin family protein [Alteromonas sp. ASW11-36]